MKKAQPVNKLCDRCLRKCKQSADVTLVTCPNFDPIPQQLTIKFGRVGKRK
ncbi:MAG: hypothetical protein K8R90_04925 [Candidatus Cloacimonetes bacterium]|nr:hypothetical protein [Candidatus Cloacimonadota bacterium]